MNKTKITTIGLYADRQFMEAAKAVAAIHGLSLGNLTIAALLAAYGDEIEEMKRRQSNIQPQEAK